MKKRLFFILFIMVILVLVLSGCSNKAKNISVIDMGISMNVPKKMIIVYTNQKTFNYNGLTIPSVSIDGVTKDQKTVMNIKSFPFPATDYINQYRSAFNGKNISVKYDYKKIKVSKNSVLKDIYESKAVIETEKGKKDSYVYLVSFKNKIGCLVIRFTGDKSKKYRNYIESIKLTNIKNFNVKSTSEKQSYSNLKNIPIKQELTIQVPNNYEVKNRISPITGTYYINFYGTKNDAIYICVTDHKPIPLSKNRWSMANATEIVKVLKTNNNLGNFIVHNINNSHLYYLNSDIKELKLKNGKAVYIRLDYLDKNNDKEFFKKVFGGISAK